MAASAALLVNATGEIYMIAADPTYQRQGVGSR
jgi:ribosomal protein S18 acetylase RimI-like enzyme